LFIHPGTAALCFALAYAGIGSMGGSLFGKEKSGKPKVTGIKDPAKWPDFFKLQQVND
jgi:hypothetical protein